MIVRGAVFYHHALEPRQLLLGSLRDDLALVVVRPADNYTGEIVSKASEEELARFKRIMVRYSTSADHWLVPEDAAEIPLT